MEATGLDVGVLLHQGALSERVQESRRELLGQRCARLDGAATANADLIGRIEGVLVMRAGWLAPWLGAEQRSALRHHLTGTVRGEGPAGGLTCGVGACPLCSEVSEQCGYDTATRCLTAVDAISAGLIGHLVSQGMVCANPQASDAARNTTSEVRNTARGPTTSPSLPSTGSSTVLASV